MRDDYHLEGPTVKVELELEKQVHERLMEMVSYTTLSQSELLNTALKRFISNHKDFLPARRAG